MAWVVRIICFFFLRTLTPGYLERTKLQPCPFRSFRVYPRSGYIGPNRSCRFLGLSGVFTLYKLQRDTKSFHQATNYRSQWRTGSVLYSSRFFSSTKNDGHTPASFYHIWNDYRFGIVATKKQSRCFYEF